ncbi:MAG: efflux RND transporter periplasmic adaptor subunit [Candidatus Rokuibacteriota bacterium]
MERNDEFIDEAADDYEPQRSARRIGLLIVLGLTLVVIGLIGGVIWAERRASKATMSGRVAGVIGRSAEQKSAGGGQTSPPSSMPGTPVGGSVGEQAGAPGHEPVEVSLTPDAMERVGIKTAEIKSQRGGAVLTVPATVMSNAYRDTKVNALVGGIVRQVSVELGTSVQRGQPLAVIFSSDLADAQMKYLSMRAMFQADHQKLQRTQKLVELGAASRQELEEVTAIHAAHETEVAAARQRLLLLGLSPDRVGTLDNASQVVAEVTVPAPANGVVIARAVNTGQVVGAGQELFVVTDLSSVWVIGDLYEKDFASVRIGAGASVTIPSAPNAPLRGRVAYIDPRVEPATRTAKVRVEVSNRTGQLRLGMFVIVGFESGGAQRITVVPRAAVQAVGDRTVVYLPADGEEGKFTERPVKLGERVGDFFTVLEGLKPGEKVVTEGSFFLRAEAAKTRAGG